jgi:hypothetical protein
LTARIGAAGAASGVVFEALAADIMAPSIGSPSPLAEVVGVRGREAVELALSPHPLGFAESALPQGERRSAVYDDRAQGSVRFGQPVFFSA